jgi:hypothetical protein
MVAAYSETINTCNWFKSSRIWHMTSTEDLYYAIVNNPSTPVHHFLANATIPAFTVTLVQRLVEEDILDIDEPSNCYQRFNDTSIAISFREDSKRAFDYYQAEPFFELVAYLDTIPPRIILPSLNPPALHRLETVPPSVLTSPSVIPICQHIIDVEDLDELYQIVVL